MSTIPHRLPRYDLANAEECARCERYGAATRAREHLLIAIAAT